LGLTHGLGYRCARHHKRQPIGRAKGLAHFIERVLLGNAPAAEIYAEIDIFNVFVTVNLRADISATGIGF
jgi:hypothetical protein